jgi:hypothetical protein
MLLHILKLGSELLNNGTVITIISLFKNIETQCNASGRRPPNLIRDNRGKRCINPKGDLQLYIHNSNEGDVYAAMKAGECIRQKEIWTIIDVGGTCASACVLMYLGSVERSSYQECNFF